MANEEPATVTIDEVKYNLADMSEEQRHLLEHITDLDRKISASEFQKLQLQVGREAFYNRLKTTLE